MPAGGPLLAATGALIPRKGQRLVDQALARLGRDDVRLALAGTRTRRSARCAPARRSSGWRIASISSARSGTTACPPLLAAADAMVLPSASEGLANAWIEALACGTPLVITADRRRARSGARRSAGRIAERTPEGIAAAVGELLADPPAQQAVAANAARFSWEANAEALVAFWREITNG